MFDIVVTDDVFQHVDRLLQQYNFGQRGIADGSPSEQRTGMIGQTCVQELFGFGKPEGNAGTTDGGYDFTIGKNYIDVKTMGRTVSPKSDYVNNFIGLQKHHPANVFIFCSYNKKTLTLTVCGWTSKDRFFELASKYPYGTPRGRADGTSFNTKAELYEIYNRNLYDVHDHIQLIAEVACYTGGLK